MKQVLMEAIKKDPDLTAYTLDKLPLLKELKERYLEVKTAVCIERAKYVTQYLKEADPDESPELKQAKAVANYLRNREPLFHNRSLIAGSTTSKELGAPVYPESMPALGIWPELDTISKRTVNPQLLTKEEAEILNFEVFPFWMDRTVLEVARKKLKEENSPTYEALQLMERIAFFLDTKVGCISHTVPYYEEALEKGLNTMIRETHQKEEALKAGEDSPGTREKIAFYQAARIALQGIIAYAQNLSQKAAQLAKEADSQEDKDHYQALADVCARVPAEPARSFREAVNSLWLIQVGIHAENTNMAMSPGRLDQVLYPYFKKDVEQNKITVEEALTLLGCLWLKISDNTNLVPESAEKMWGGAGSVPAVTLGGIDKDGNDAVNDLTYLMLKVTELLVIKDPNVNARYHDEINDKTYFDRVCRVIINTKAIPALYNDIANIAALENQGVKTEHARDYAVVGCVELGSAGREYAATSAIMFNLTSAMDLALYNGKRPYLTGDWQIGPKTGEPDELKTFEDFQTAFETQLKSLIEKAIDLNNEFGRLHQQLQPTPLLSSFFVGPLEKGKDLIFGGALYNSSGATHIGFADVCDSLNAIEHAVYREKKITLAQLRNAVGNNFESKKGKQDAVGNNFASYEDLRQYLKNKTPKYGMDDSNDQHPTAVKNSKRLIKFLYETYQGRENYRGGKYRPAFWTMTNHAGLGYIGQALPSGRKAHEVFSSGITPASQCAQDLTGAYKSVALLDSRHIPGGVALNMKYTPQSHAGNGKYLENFTNMVKAYFKSGGMQVQYNIQDYKTLEDARDHPEKEEYKQLIVRVSGYSAYFKDLNPYMKHELIIRTQYDLDSGNAVPYTAGMKGGEEQ